MVDNDPVAALDASTPPPSLFPQTPEGQPAPAAPAPSPKTAYNPANDPFAEDLHGFELAPAKPKTAYNPNNDPFAEDLEGVELAPGSSATGAFIHHAETGILPTLGALPAIGRGAMWGGRLGALGGPLAEITIPVGTIAGAVAGGAVASGAASWLQDKAIANLPETWTEAMGISQRQQQLEEKQHPYASFVGSLAPSIIAFRPGGWAAAALPADASAFEKAMANPITSRLFGGALQGGIELAHEYVAGQSPDWTKTAIAFGFGVAFNHPTRIGQRLIEIGEGPRPAAPVTPTAAPAVGEPAPVEAPPAQPAPAETPRVSAGDWRTEMMERDRRGRPYPRPSPLER
jgi:hypothetical protein